MRAFHILYIAILLLAFPQLSMADTKPTPGFPVTGSEIGNLFNGKTWKWPNGYAFFAPGGQFRASRSMRESADGKWYAQTSGKICAEALWTTVSTQSDFKKCWAFLKDKDRRYWLSSSDAPSEWHIFDPETELVRGDVARAEYDYARLKRVPIDVHLVDTNEIAQMFGLKSWIWDNGIAYFGNDGVFRATSKSGSVAEGRWYVREKGQVCYAAKWMSSEGTTTVTECWTHAKDNRDRLWQRTASEPEGWYLFDPQNKLVTGDVGRIEFEANKKLIEN